MDSIAQTLAQALLDHHRDVCRVVKNRNDKALTDDDVDSTLIRYGVLRSKTNVRLPAIGFGRPLCIIAEWCRRNGWPPINSLVVSSKGKPGSDYSRAPGCGGSWEADVRKCICWKRYPKNVENWLA